MKEQIDRRSNLEGSLHSRLPKFTEKEKKYIRGTVDIFYLQTYQSASVTATEIKECESSPSFISDMAANSTQIEGIQVSVLSYFTIYICNFFFFRIFENSGNLVIIFDNLLIIVLLIRKFQLSN